MTVDEAIKVLGLPLLRELHAIAWFCDCSSDGKLALIPSDRRKRYEPGGEMAPLVELACIRLLSSGPCADIKQHRPAIRMNQFGRQVLVRAKALRMELQDESAMEEVDG